MRYLGQFKTSLKQLGGVGASIVTTHYADKALDYREKQREEAAQAAKDAARDAQIASIERKVDDLHRQTCYDNLPVPAKESKVLQELLDRGLISRAKTNEAKTTFVKARADEASNPEAAKIAEANLDKAVNEQGSAVDKALEY